jgi:hypothetical protein
MTASTPRLLRAIRRYAGKIRTMRNEIRTERLLNSLPSDIRKDIGWPDSFAARYGRHE